MKLGSGWVHFSLICSLSSPRHETQNKSCDVSDQSNQLQPPINNWNSIMGRVRQLKYFYVGCCQVPSLITPQGRSKSCGTTCKSADFPFMQGLGSEETSNKRHEMDQNPVAVGFWSSFRTYFGSSFFSVKHNISTLSCENKGKKLFLVKFSKRKPTFLLFLILLHPTYCFPPPCHFIHLKL